MRFARFGSMGALGLALALGLVACGDDSDGGDDGSAVDAGGGSGGTGGSVGTGGSGGTGGAPPAECVTNSYDGITEACASCMCACEPTASECGENCWKLSNCVYFQCQMMANQGEADEMACTDKYCSGYYDTDSTVAGTLGSCFASCGPSDCVAWWTMQVPPMGADTDGGVEDAGH